MNRERISLLKPFMMEILYYLSLNGNGIELNSSRRDFLKLCGFSFALGALSSCKSKISKAIPYVIAPREMTPGEALWYASSYVNGSDYCSIIVKTRDGRPIKIEGNPCQELPAVVRMPGFRPRFWTFMI